jgi:rSAM/selenodomain-associated transferase 2/rSAM/selenodomain-associated transferase 1
VWKVEVRIEQEMPTGYQKRLMIFARYPEPGTTKTRLIPVLGANGAADLQRKMTENTVSQMEPFSVSPQITVEIHYEGGDEGLMKNWLGHGFVYRPQVGGDIGVRMQRSFEEAFKKGADSAILIGTDIPGMSTAVVQDAFDALKQNHMVLGPARDGGYYLIGLKRDISPHVIPDLFSGIKWGSGTVLNETLRIARDSGLCFSLLKVLEDVDRPQDLPIWEKALNSKKHGFSNERISVIIPTLNEADNIEKTIERIGTAKNREIIVVDGGSHDNTVPLAKSLGATVITASPPKARQMNTGAAAATGNILLFLHADTWVPERFDEHVINALSQSNVVAGAFALRIDSPASAFRRIERLANWRSRRLRLPYGDQGLFMTSELFRQMGGFCDIPIMEDFELARRLRKKGEVVTLAVSAVTSARRWQRRGILRTTLINQLVITAYCAGFSLEAIERWYCRSRGVSGKN